MNKPLPSYPDMARELDVVLCTGCGLGEATHQSGKADPSMGVVHWRNRVTTRPGARNFLKLIASIYRSHNRGQPEWLILYEQNMYAARYARRFGFRIPSRLMNEDRATVLWQTRDQALSRTNPAIWRWAHQVKEDL